MIATRPRRWLDRALRHPVLFVVLVAMLVRITAAVVIRIQYGGAIFPDDLTYPQLAAAMASGATDSWDSYTYFLYRTTAALTFPLTLLYRIFGPEILLGQLFVASFGAATAGLTAKLVSLRLPSGFAIFAGLCVGLLPSQVLWSSLTLKDALVWAALAGLAVAVAVANASAHSRRLLTAALTSAALLTALVYLRPHTLVVACWALLLAACVGQRRGRVTRLAGTALLVVAIPWGLAGIGPMGVSLVLSPGSLEERRANNAGEAATAFVPNALGETPEQIAGRLEAQNRAAALRAAAEAAQAEAARVAAAAEQDKVRLAALAAGSGTTEQGSDVAAATAQAQRSAELAAEAQLRAAAVAVKLEGAERAAVDPGQDPEVSRTDFGDENVTSSNVRQLPRGLAVMLVEPYPWRSTDNERVDQARAEMVLWYPLLLLAALGLPVLRRHATALAFPLLATGAIALMYALSEGNFGTAYRHRGEFVWSVCTLAAFGLHSVTRWRPSMRSLATGKPRDR